jgi:mannose-6-phosphate isomerase-like protein (cupin superfamily)
VFKSINIKEELNQVKDFWFPRIVGKVNNQHIKVAKLEGTFTWHSHDDEDELFYVIKGWTLIEFEKGSVRLDEGDFYVVPRGLKHNPIAKEECWIILIESVTTKHTGNVILPDTKYVEQKLN